MIISEWMTVSEVANTLGCSVQYVRYLVGGRNRKYQTYFRREKPIIEESMILRKQTKKTTKYFIHQDAVKTLVMKRVKTLLKNNKIML